MAKGFGIPKRRALLERIGEIDRGMYEELLVLRHYNPQAFRKHLRRYSRTLGLTVRDQAPGTSAWVPEVDAANGPAASTSPRSGPDLAVLDGSVAEVKKALASGEHDTSLDALLEAESSGKARKGVLAALHARAEG